MCYFSYVSMHLKEDSKENAVTDTHMPSSLHETNFIVLSIWELLKSRSHVLFVLCDPPECYILAHLVCIPRSRKLKGHFLLNFQQI